MGTLPTSAAQDQPFPLSLPITRDGPSLQSPGLEVIQFSLAEPAEKLGPSQGWFIHHNCFWQIPPPKKTYTDLGAQLKLWSLECILTRTLPLKGVWSKHSHMSYLFP